MGRVFRPNYRVRGPDGEWVVKATEAYHIEYTDAQGRTRRRKAGLTKEQAKDALRQAEAGVLAERNGLPVRRIADIPCADLAKEYLAHQQREVCPDHYTELKRRLEAALAGTRSLYLADLTPEAVDRFLDTLSDKHLSARTVNTYLQAVRGMLNWAVAKKKIPYNPLLGVGSRSGDTVRKRRPLSPEESERLLWEALRGAERRLRRCYGNGLRPEQQLEVRERGDRNALIYSLMLRTGLRLNEIRSSTWADVDLDAGVLHCRAAWTKNGRDDDLPLPAQLVGQLRQWKAQTGAAAADPVVHVPASILSDFDDDCAAAGIAKQDAAGRTMDLHCLRHTYGQRLSETGADVKVVQSLMRHSSPTLTFGIYVHRDQRRMADAVKALPDLNPRPPKPEADQAQAATGTDDACPLPPRDRQGDEAKTHNSLPAQALASGAGSPSKLVMKVRFPSRLFFFCGLLELLYRQLRWVEHGFINPRSSVR